MPATDKKIGVTLIGSGDIAKEHAKSFLNIPDAKLVGVFGIDALQAKSFAAKFKIKAYGSLQEVLADPEVAVVDIASIHNTHAEIGLLAAASGKHVIVEKPLDADLKQARQLVEACKKNGVYLATIFQQRFSSNIDKLKKIIDDEQLGRILMASARLASSRDQAYYDAGGGWRGRKQEAGGGVFINQAIHIIDALIYLVGEPAEVFGSIETATHDIEVEDTGVGIIKFRNHAVAVISATTSAYRSLPNLIEIHGTKGSAVISGDTLTVTSARDSRSAKLKNKLLAKINRFSPFFIEIRKKYKNAYHQENLQAIISAIKEDRRPPAAFGEGLKSLEAAEALLTSAGEKKTAIVRPFYQRIKPGDYYKKYLNRAKQERPAVLIVNPLNVTDSNIKFSHIGQHRQRQPLDLAYISSFLKKITGVQLVDAAILRWGTQKTIDFINEVKPQILIMTSTSLDRWQNPDLDISYIFKIFNQTEAPYKILVGAHGTVTPQWIFDNAKVDFVVRGEPEKTCLELTEKILSGQKDFSAIAGLSYRAGEQVLNNSDRQFNDNLDDYPLPDYDALPMELYHYTLDDLLSPFSLMLTSRGCPGQCVFCLKKMMPDRYRVRSAENVFAEIKYLVERFGVRSIYFQDWEFLIDKERVKKLCRLLIDEAEFSVIWGCSARATSLDPETVKLMSQAGCILINFGYESGSPEILQTSHKGVSSSVMKQAVELCQNNRINLRPFCLVNLPGETVKTIKESADFVAANGLAIPHINIPIPYPGTELAERINCRSWSESLDQTGRVDTVLDPGRAKQLLKKYLRRGQYGRFYFLNYKFWLHLFRLAKYKLIK